MPDEYNEASLLRKFKTMMKEMLEPIEQKCDAASNNALRAIEKINREKNFVIFGLPEGNDEKTDDLIKLVDELFAKMGVTGVLVDDLFRLGKKKSGSKQPRPLLLKLVRMLDKKRIREARRKLGKADPVIVDDKSKDEIAVEKKLLEKFSEMKKKDKTLKKRIIRGKMTVFKDKKELKSFVWSEEDMDIVEA